jgi:hypothetical protein
MKRRSSCGPLIDSQYDYEILKYKALNIVVVSDRNRFTTYFEHLWK